MSNNQIAVYDSASEAARILFNDVSKSSLIRQCARGTKKNLHMDINGTLFDNQIMMTRKSR